MMALGPGARLGKYRLEAAIGAGGMGHVWAARNELTGAQVALKVLAGGHDEESSARFRQEARIGAVLMHRNVVRVFDLVEDPSGALVLVMERLRGETLDKILTAACTLSPRCAVAVMQGALDGLAHAHEKGFVHRDVKPSNIFLAVESDGVLIPKLLDFGIARAVGRTSPITRAGMLVGTPDYMSPEQIASKSVDQRSDLFACGTVLYEALTGRTPFAADSLNATLVAILQRRVKRPPEIPELLWGAIAKALTKRPADRFDSARAFSRALQDALATTPEELAASLQRIPVRAASMAPSPAAGSMDGLAVATPATGDTANDAAGETDDEGATASRQKRAPIRTWAAALGASLVLMAVAAAGGFVAIASTPHGLREAPMLAMPHELRRAAPEGTHGTVTAAATGARAATAAATTGARVPPAMAARGPAPPEVRPPPQGIATAHGIATEPGF